jgi:hypothetical protein
MPMREWDQSQKARGAPAKERPLWEKVKDIKNRVLLRSIEKQYNKALEDKKEKPSESSSTNDNLVKD